MAKSNNPQRLLLDNYPFQITIPTRFSDLDTLRHVNNVAIASLYEESRVQFHREVFREFRNNAAAETPVRRALVDIHIQYLREVHFPQPVTIGVGISHIGNTSYTMASVLIQNGEAAGLSEAVMVFMDADKSSGMPTEARQALTEYCLKC